jgi:folate-binding protein YgfZ
MSSNALTGALSACVVRVRGKDALSVLHNVSTQRLADIAPGEARLTLFCDFRGRLLHRAVVARSPDDEMWLVREDEAGLSLASHLDHSVFREAVHIEDLSARFSVTPSFAPLAAPGASAPGVAAFVAGAPARIEVPGCPIYTLGPAGGAMPDAAAWSRERIARGWGAQGCEVTDAFHPFEVHLAHGVHLDKGCYTGQEALMRLVTYRSVRRHLVRLSGSGEVRERRELTDPVGERAGVLTSLAGTADAWTALAVVRNDTVTEGASVRVGDTASATVAQAFTPTQPGGRPLHPPR